MERKLGIYLIVIGLIAIGLIVTSLITLYIVNPPLVYYENRVTIIFYVCMILIVIIVLGIYIVSRKI